MSDWQLCRLREIATIHSGGTPSTEDPSYWGGGIPWLTPGELAGNQRRYISMTVQSISRSGLRSSGTALLPPGSLLVTTRATLGARAVAQVPIATNQGFKNLVFDKKETDVRFYYHLFGLLEPEMRRRASGTTFLELSTRQFGEIIVPVPSLTEQRRIADVLDTVDGEVESTRCMAAKEASLKRGLIRELSSTYFETYPMMDLNEIAALITSGSRGWADYYADEGAFFVRIGNLTRERINLRFDECVYVQPPKTAEGSRTALESNDVLISITADLGIVGVVPSRFGEAYVNQHVALVRVRPEFNPRWVAYMLASELGQRQFQLANDSGAKAGLNLPAVGRVQVPLPPRAVQDEVTGLLDEQDCAIVRYQGLMEKLLLLKQGLMDDLLTGRVRVTGGGMEHVGTG